MQILKKLLNADQRKALGRAVKANAAAAKANSELAETLLYVGQARASRLAANAATKLAETAETFAGILREHAKSTTKPKDKQKNGAEQ